MSSAASWEDVFDRFNMSWRGCDLDELRWVMVRCELGRDKLEVNS
jgi:hypothetical protein